MGSFMGRHSLVVHNVFGLSAGFLVVLLAFSMTATAADYIPSGQPIPQGIKWVNATTTGANTSAWASYGSTVNKFPVPVNSATLGKLTKFLLKKAIPFAGTATLIKDLVNGVGWVIDELKKEVQTPAIPGDPPTGTFEWCISSGQQMRCGDPALLCQAITTFVCYRHVFRGTGAPGQGLELRFQNLADYNASPGPAKDMYTTGNATWTQMPSGGWQQWHAPNGAPAKEIGDYELGELVKHHPEIVNAVLIDPQTGAPIRTPELINALNALAAALAAANGVPAPPPLVADPELGQGTTPSQTDWPAWCDWATNVCEFIDWFKGEGEQPMELPETELNITPSNWTSGIGNGSCPVAETVFVDGPGSQGEVRFDWTPLCEGATKLRPVLLTVSAIVAGFIIAGLRKGSV